MNIHTNYDLLQMQSLSLESKILMSRQRIKAWLDYWDDMCYVAYSGGKDSRVLVDLVKDINKDIPIVFCNTGLESDSVREMGKKYSDIELHPIKDFLTIISEKGYPIYSKTVSHNVHTAQVKPNGKLAKRYFSGEMAGSRFDCTRYKWLIEAPFLLSDSCCGYMKKKPSHKYSKESGRVAIVGTMAEESQTRYKNWLQHGCNAFNTENPTSAPLSFWTEQDILEYIYTRKLDIASEYGSIIKEDNLFYTTGANRTGCIFCMFGITQDKERFVRLRESDPIKYNYIMRGGAFDIDGYWKPKNGLGYKFVIDWLNEHGNLDIKY